MFKTLQTQQIKKMDNQQQLPTATVAAAVATGTQLESAHSFDAR